MSERPPESIDFEDEMRRYLYREPFIPFEIIVTSGDHYRVTDPAQVAVAGNTVVTALPKSGTRFFRKNQIVAVHVDESDT